MVTIAHRGLPSGRVQHRLDVERRPGRPCRERRRGEQPVELHRQPHPVVGREELVELEHTELADRRVADHARRASAGRAHRPSPHECAIRFDSRMCSRLVSGSASIADQPEQPGDVALDLVADDLGVAGVGRDLQRADDVDRHTRLRPGRVDREVGGGAERGDVLGRSIPTRAGPWSTSRPAARRTRRA